MRSGAHSRIAFGIFLCFGAGMAMLAATLLLLPGTFLDKLWVLNPTAQRQLTAVGNRAGLLFVLLSFILAVAAIGWFKSRPWGWRLAVIILIVHLAGDVGNILLGRLMQGVLGVIVAGVLLIYLLRPTTRAQFVSMG
ncbi:MAG TPA: hypothetical protein VFW31_08465 [Candidatus Angelobacter sp.]|nr:hypothetical protein [Candidatus Angelobacter sp.]